MIDLDKFYDKFVKVKTTDGDTQNGVVTLTWDDDDDDDGAGIGLSASSTDRGGILIYKKDIASIELA